MGTTLPRLLLRTMTEAMGLTRQDLYWSLWPMLLPGSTWMPTVWATLHDHVGVRGLLSLSVPDIWLPSAVNWGPGIIRLQLRTMSESVALLHSVFVDVCGSWEHQSPCQCWGSRMLPGTVLISEGYAAVGALLVRMIYIATWDNIEIWALTGA